MGGCQGQLVSLGGGIQFVPAHAGGGDQCLCQIATGRLAREQLLRLRGQATRLWPQLGENVAQTLEICLRLGQLALRLAAPSLVAAHAGRLLEQGSALLRPQRESLVDHALADE